MCGLLRTRADLCGNSVGLNDKFVARETGSREQTDYVENNSRHLTEGGWRSEEKEASQRRNWAR